MLQGSVLYCMNAFMEPLCEVHGWTRAGLNLSMGFAALMGQLAMPLAAAVSARCSLRRLMALGALAGGVLLALPMVLLRAQGMERALSLTPLRALAVGLVEGVGTVVPGLSTSFILINLGWYQAYLDALAHPQAGLLALVALGFAASALVSMKAVQWLFDHARGYTCYAVLGFLLVSVALVFPGFGSGWTLWAQLAALLAGLLVARWMGGLGEPVATTSKG